jgi:hypothetical protein
MQCKFPTIAALYALLATRCDVARALKWAKKHSPYVHYDGQLTARDLRQCINVRGQVVGVRGAWF